MALRPHSDPFPNSVVKLKYGHDTWRVASWDNSSLPGSFLDKTPALLCGGFVVWSFSFKMHPKGEGGFQ
jgi:hypothetical protein